jgi:hypothetical protein
MEEMNKLNIIEIQVLFRYNKKILKYFSNLLDDNIGSLSSFDDLFERPCVANGDRLVSLLVRSIFSGFFRQTICSINMIEDSFL